MRPHTIRRAAGVLVAAASAALLAAPASAQGDAPTYARAVEGAVARNFPDENGNVLARLEAGRLLRVHSTSRGIPPFHEVEVAGGVPVWVYGELLQRTDVEGVLRVNASHVNMRPLPEATPRSMALRSKLQAGERVLLIERADASKPLAQDWVKIWSPGTARVWVPVDDVEPVADASAAASEWESSRRAIPRPSATPPSGAGARPAGAGTDEASTTPATRSVSRDAVEALARAERLFDASVARAGTTSQEWAEVLGAYQDVVGRAPDGSATGDTARRRIGEVRARMELAALREDVHTDQARREEELERLARQRHARDLERTTHWGRFQGRGWIEGRVVNGQRRHYIVWGGETTAEVRCSTGRYDLDVFQGFEIGVMGTTAAPPVAASEAADGRPLPRILDVYRIEVISGSATRR